MLESADDYITTFPSQQAKAQQLKVFFCSDKFGLILTYECQADSNLFFLKSWN